MASATALTTEAASAPVHAQNHKWPSNMSTSQAWDHLSVDSLMMANNLWLKWPVAMT